MAGKPSSSVNGDTSAPVEFLPATSAAPLVSPELFVNAIGCAVASAGTGRSVQLQTADGLRVRPGFSLVLAAEDSTHATTVLNRIIAPLKYAQAKKHAALAMLD